MLLQRRVANRSKTKAAALCTNRWKFITRAPDPFNRPEFRTRNAKAVEAIMSSSFENYVNTLVGRDIDLAADGSMPKVAAEEETETTIRGLVQAAYSRLQKEETDPGLRSEKAASPAKKSSARLGVAPLDENYQKQIESTKQEYASAKRRLRSKLDPGANNLREASHDKCTVRPRESDEDLRFVLPPIERQQNAPFGRYALLIKREHYDRELPILKPVIECDHRRNNSTIASGSKSQTRRRGTEKKRKVSRFSLVQRLANEATRRVSQPEKGGKEANKTYVSAKLAEQIKDIRDLLEDKHAEYIGHDDLLS